MAENKLADMSAVFAVKILNLTDGIKGHYSLANQLERSGTSIGANIISEEIANNFLHECGLYSQNADSFSQHRKGEQLWVRSILAFQY